MERENVRKALHRAFRAPQDTPSEFSDLLAKIDKPGGGREKGALCSKHFSSES